MKPKMKKNRIKKLGKHVTSFEDLQLGTDWSHVEWISMSFVCIGQWWMKKKLLLPLQIFISLPSLLSAYFSYSSFSWMPIKLECHNCGQGLEWLSVWCLTTKVRRTKLRVDAGKPHKGALPLKLWTQTRPLLSQRVIHPLGFRSINMG